MKILPLSSNANYMHHLNCVPETPLEKAIANIGIEIENAFSEFDELIAPLVTRVSAADIVIQRSTHTPTEGFVRFARGVSRDAVGDLQQQFFVLQHKLNSLHERRNILSVVDKVEIVDDEESASIIKADLVGNADSKDDDYIVVVIVKESKKAHQYTYVYGEKIWRESEANFDDFASAYEVYKKEKTK